MAFNFQAYRNPYVSTIAELLSRGEDAKAKALVDVANAQARAAEARGQAYGGAIESVGKIVSGIPAQIQAGKDQAFKNEQQAQARLEFADKATERAELAKGKEAVGFLASLNQGPDPNYQRDPATGTSRYEGPPSPDYSGLFDQGDFGQKTFNPAKTRQALNAAGYGAYADQLMVNVGKQNQEVAQFVQGRNDTVAQAASHALAMLRAPKVDGSKTAWADAVNGAGAALVANDIYTQSQLNALIASGQDQSRQGQEQLLIGLMGKSSQKAVSLAPGTTSMLLGQEISKVAEKLVPSSAALQTLDQARADYGKGIRDGSIPQGTSFTDWNKAKSESLPTSVQEYNFAVKNDGFKGTYNDWSTMDANRRRSLTVNNAATDDSMIAQAARNIVDNPRDMTSPRTLSSLRGDQRMKLFNEIKRISPDFNVGNIERQIKFLDSYENPSGRAAINRSSMNNILMHAADLSAVNERYRRSNIRLTNTVISKIAAQGGTEWSQFMTPLAVLKDEIGLYFAGGYAPKGKQLEAWDAILNDTATPAQVEQFAKDIIHVGLRRADTANQSFKTMMGYDDPNLITPEAVQAGLNLGLGDEVKKYGSGGQIGARGNAAPGTPIVVGKYKVVVN